VDERRLLIAFSLSLLVLIVFQALFPAHPPKPADTPTASATAAVPQAPATTASAPAAAPVARPEIPAKSDEQERRIDVQTRDIEVGLTNRGARVLSWRLTQFRDGNSRPEEMVQTAPSLHPLDVETGDAAIDQKLRDALFVASESGLSLGAGEEKSLRFEYASGDLSVVKKLTFTGTGYLVSVEVSVRRGGIETPKTIVWGPGIGNPSEAERQVRGYQEPSGAALVDGRVNETVANKIGDRLSYNDAAWVGVDGHYFAAIWVPSSGHGQAELRQAALPALPNGEARAGAAAGLLLGPTDKALLYVGPKEYRRLAALGHELGRIVNVGSWFGPIPFHLIVIGFMDLLEWLHARIGNWGWSVILLTVLINVVMSPLRHYGIVNGQKMAKISPEMKVIQDRYRKVPALDPRRQEMQKEMAALYERHGMSMGTQMALGCFPTLLTLPFLYAIYRVLAISIELRGAEFLWIPDLSQKDPLFITPIVMAISMFISQRSMPTSMDPAQQRMMMVMPIVFMTMFFAAPAGLNLYWFASNVCTILQQLITLRIIRGREGALITKEKRAR